MPPRPRRTKRIENDKNKVQDIVPEQPSTDGITQDVPVTNTRALVEFHPPENVQISMLKIIRGIYSRHTDLRDILTNVLTYNGNEITTPTLYNVLLDSERQLTSDWIRTSYGKDPYPNIVDNGLMSVVFGKFDVHTYWEFQR